MSTEPDAEGGWKPPVWLQVFVVVLVAALIFWGFVAHGEKAARQCAVDYPHEGQCGLEAMQGDAFGVFAGSGILVVGLAVIAVRYFRAKVEPEE